MSGVYGTTISVKKLYNNSESVLRFLPDIGDELYKITLGKGRHYIIPNYQREIRWESGQLITLISDIQHGDKFLGNIILSMCDDGNFEILDGQQRTTTIYLIVKYIETKYKNRFPNLDLCQLDFYSFSGFWQLFLNSFDQSKFADSDYRKLLDSDDYNQYYKYIKIWSEIESSEYLNTPDKARKWLDNLYKCELNIIINTDSSEQAIQRFLDVNLKGIKLDTEDIFKGNLCALNNSAETHEKWKKIKKFSASINPIVNSSEDSVYPLMTLIEHFFRCAMSKHVEYKKIVFNSDFLLSENQEIECSQYCKGTHILSAINDNSYISTCLDDLIKIMELIESIIKSPDRSEKFNAYIGEYNKRAPSKKRIQDLEIRVMNNLIRKILRDKKYDAPKCLLMRYFLDLIYIDSCSDKELKNIYTVSSAALVFSLFEFKKELKCITKLIEADDWCKASYDYVVEKIKSESNSTKILRVSFDATMLEEADSVNNTQKFRCKTLATIYEYCEFVADRVQVKSLSSLDEFLNDERKFSFEHFIINDSDKIEYENTKGVIINFEYPKKIKQYKYSLLNFIFIPEKLNNDLGNLPVSIKCKELTSGRFKKDFDDVNSEYSRMLVSNAETCFKMPDLDLFDSAEDAEKALKEYYDEPFRQNMADFTKAVFTSIGGLL